MSKVLWKSPVPSTAYLEKERLEITGDVCSIAFEYEGLDDEIVHGRLQFDGVEGFRWTGLYGCSAEMVEASYDKLVDRGDSEWLTEMRHNLREYNAALTSPVAKHSNSVAKDLNSYIVREDELKHMMIFFDGGPCYEFICRTFSFSQSPSE